MSNSPCEINHIKARSYSITSDSDHNHNINGRCPNYALLWNHHDNSRHWPDGHDYFIGNGINMDDDSRLLREILSKKLATGTLVQPIIFCDLDGVLANFEEGVKNKFGKPVDEIKPALLWGVINKSKTFFDTLPWMPKGKQLWDNIKQYEPIILTGVPGERDNLIQQKIKWCQRELGPDIQVITCLTKNKSDYCLPNFILIDDRTDNLKSWNEKGGKFILYDEEHLEPILERIHRHMISVLPSP